MRVTLAVAVACLALGGLAVADDTKAAMRRMADIPPEGLGSALTTLAQQFEFQVLYQTEVVGAKRTEGVSGAMTAAEALERVLSGTGLTYRYLDERTVMIMPTTSATPGGITGRESNGGSEHREDDQPQSFWDRFRLAQVGQGAPGSSSSVEGNNRDSSDPDQGDSRRPRLEEVIVTATRREERLIDTPQSVTALNPSELMAGGATQLRDFADSIPGMSLNTHGAGNSQITLRGVNTGADLSATTSIYVDDVPYGSTASFSDSAAFTFDAGLFDLDRIEVLRGPQGTLYGESSMGGLIKYVTKQPDATQFGGSVLTGVSSTHDGGVSYNTAGVVNAPIVTDKVALRASGFETHDGGYIDNIQLGVSNVNRSDVYGGRLDLLIKPIAALSIRLTGVVQNTSRVGNADVDYTSTGTPTYGDLKQVRFAPEPFHQRFQLASAAVNYDFGPATLTAISSYQTIWNDNFTDITALDAAVLDKLLGYNYSTVAADASVRVNKTTQEMRIASNKGTSLDWVLGAFYSHESAYTGENYITGGDAAGNPVPNNLLNYFAPSRNDEVAGFGDVTWKLTNRFDVTGGLRYARDTVTDATDATGLFGVSEPGAQSSDRVVTYLGNARYRFADDQMAYLRYSTGYRPGGPNVQVKNLANGLPEGASTFQSDTLKSYEAGYKAAFADGRIGVDLAVYDIEWSNIQVSTVIDTFGVIANAPGGARLRGSELSLTGRPIDGLLVVGALDYQDAYMKQDDKALGATAGERMPNAPRFTTALNADYSFAGNLQPTIGTTARYVDARQASFDHSVGYPQYNLPAYVVMDLRAGLRFDQVSAQLYIRNVFDERAQLSASTNLGMPRVAISQPRTIGVTVTTRF